MTSSAELRTAASPPGLADAPRAADQARRPGLGRRLWRRSRSLVYPLVTLLVVLVAWQVVVEVLGVEAYVLPAPTDVLASIRDNWSYLLQNSWPTLQIILVGFLLSVAIGMPLAMLIAGSPVVEKFVYPLLVVAQTFPKIAIAPLLVIWFGFTTTPKVLVTILIAFFPVTVSTVVGLKSVPAEMIDLARSMRAGRMAAFWRIRFPYALPHVFSGLKVAITMAVIGAIVGEFVGADRGLGYVLIIASGRLESDLVFAAVFFLVAIGMISFFAIQVLERLAIPWHESVRRDSRAT